ncbi:MAG TPA: MFS transporter [Novosphingobium sp.]|nr:MFS transporter [Novosphingobium sp.]
MASRDEARASGAWSILLGAALCMFCGQAAAMLFTFGVFAPEIAAATGWPPVTVAAAIGPAMMVASLLAPLVGRAADAFGVRRMALVGGPAYGFGLVMVGLLPQGPGQFVVVLTVASALGFAASPVLYAQLATRWFTRRRGLSLSLIFASASLGVAFWSPLAAKLIELYGWRAAYAGLGIMTGSVLLLCALFLLRDPPAPALAGAPAQAAGMTLPEALRGGTFWLIAAVFMIQTAVLAGVTVNLPVLLRLQGISPVTAATVMAVAGGAMFVGRISAGLLLDRWFSPFVMAGFTLLPIMGLAVLLFELSPATLYFAAMLIGLGLGSEMDAAAYIVSRAFGVRRFGAIYGMIALAFGLASAAGPATTGAALSRGIPPSTLFAIGLAALVASLVLVLSLRRRHLPFGIDLPVQSDPLQDEK